MYKILQMLKTSAPLNTLDRGLSDILLSNVLILELDDEGLELFVLSNIDTVLLRFGRRC
jgi:hypothetical protein